MAQPLTRDSWFQLRTMFEDVKDLPAASQEEFIRRHCVNDPGLERALAGLLEAHRLEDRFLDRPLPERLRCLDSATPQPDPPTAEDLTGSVLRDRYQVLRLVRQGGSSRIYLAEDRLFEDRKVVVKQIVPLTEAPAAVFQSEVLALSRLHHSGITRPLDSGLTPGGDPFLVLDYIPGPTLREILDAGPLPVDRALRLAAQIGDALTEAHTHGVIHLDLKPENIIVSGPTRRAEQAVLLDFGIAQRLADTAGSQPALLGGSPAYMAPEQFAGRPAAASDQYALALIAREMLGESAPDAEHVLRRALAPEPAARYATVGAFVEALLTISLPVRRDRTRLLITLIVTLTLLLVGLSGWVWMRETSSQQGSKTTLAPAHPSTAP